MRDNIDMNLRYLCCLQKLENIAEYEESQGNTKKAIELYKGVIYGWKAKVSGRWKDEKELIALCENDPYPNVPFKSDNNMRAILRDNFGICIVDTVEEVTNP